MLIGGVPLTLACRLLVMFEPGAAPETTLAGFKWRVAWRLTVMP
ncbi:hypothetical protein [Methylobrevis pamukkalensis]|uniref:Uncharacterized protein n=1 Tax=Methylobrevis pamukkalensis TaxID=1439726 RepID=A0A1E3H4D2_9HYPH|nr:hypothetical protein [Methylobrevis pamukkalensis]ODN71170.1 hypothetical protein A6302_01459 [Methylobrevis pamukkalensis]